MPVLNGALRALLLTGALGAFSVGAAHGQGDGSFTNNPDLLRGSFSPFCEPAMLCHHTQLPSSVASPVDAATTAPASTGPLELAVSQPRTSSASDESIAPPKRDPVYPIEPSSPWRASYGIALRGSFVHSSGANRYEALLIPNVALRYSGQVTQASLSTSATIVQPYRADTRISAADIAARFAHWLGPTTQLELDAAIAVSQDDPSGIDLAATGVMTAPLEFRGSVDTALTRSFGQFDLTASLGASRIQTGPTRLIDGGTIDNSGTDRTRIDTGMRLGYRLTPILGVFVSGNAGREMFDKVAPDIGASRSGWDFALRGGVTANWYDMTSLEASIGSGWRTYDDTSLDANESLLYGLAIGYSPNSSLRLRAALDTAIEPGTNGVVASVDHTLSFEAAYKINQWLGLRGSANGSWSEAVDSGALTRRYGAGLGADIALGPHSDFTLDYNYGWRSDPAATPEVSTEHRVSAGVTLQY